MNRGRFRLSGWKAKGSGLREVAQILPVQPPLFLYYRTFRRPVVAVLLLLDQSQDDSACWRFLSIYGSTWRSTSASAACLISHE